jgi:uncharacterized protein YbbC (DUF1343 family)
VHFRPIAFEPTFHKHAGTLCGGCQIHVLDRATFEPVAAGVAIIDACRHAGPDRFAWRDPPYEYEYTKPPIDILYGSAGLRHGLATGRTAAELARDLRADAAAFLDVRRRWLLY